MHESITEHISYERGKNEIKDGEEYFDSGLKRDIQTRAEQSKVPSRDEIKSSFNHIETQLEELLHLVGDRKKPATEDEIMNYVIGMIESVRIKRDKLTNIWRGF